MKKVMTTVASIVLSALAYSGSVQASEVVFDAARDCQARDTTQGVRYVPACDFDTNRLITPDSYNNLSSGSFMSDANFKTMLNYDFTCESLKPLSISLAMVGDGVEKFTADIAGSPTSNVDVASITHSYLLSALKLKSLNGATGFQAIKPGCQMSVDALVSYPDPAYFKALVNGIKQMDMTLAFLLSVASPSADYITALNAIENGITMLVFQKDMAFDDLMKDLIQLAIDDLQNAKNTLSVNCQANSSSTYCSQALADTRSALSALINNNNSQLSEMKSFLNSQLSWLTGQGADLRGDLAALQDVYNLL